MLDEIDHSGLDDVGSREELGAALTRLREHAGLSIRDLSKRTGIPSGTISGYFTGRHVPPASALPQLRGLLGACGVAEADMDAWVEACNRARRAPGRRPADAPLPYRGLRSYESGDQEWFVGREELADALERLVDELPPSGIAVLVGASGTGKSSLVRAGLLPRGLPGEITLVTPGREALDVLRVAAGGLGPCLVVIDQAEELFAPGAAALLQETLSLITAGPMAALLVLRSDFYAAAAEQPLLVPALQGNQLVVTPPTEDDLRRIILEPAKAAGLDVEPGFADVLLRDVAPRSTGDGTSRLGVLPLLSHALLATLERGNRRSLRIADYQAIGGLEGAVARTAEDAYQRLTPAQRERARDLFLRLVHVVDGSPVARRRALPSQLAGEGSESDERAVLDGFVTARLLTVSDSGVSLTHEALLWAWPRLQSWIDADREGQVVLRTVRDAARLWDEHDRDEALLHRGSPLSAALAWASDSPNAARLSPLERDFLSASAARLQQESRRETRRARRLRYVAAGLAVMLVAAVTFAALAVTAGNRADHERQLAVSRLLALTSARVLGTDPGAALQLAAAAYRTAPTFEARSAVLTAAGLPVPVRIPGDGLPLQAVDVDLDGLTVVGGASGQVRLLLNASGPGKSAKFETAATLHAGGNTVFTVAISPDRHRLAAAGADGKVFLWDVTDPRHPAPLGTRSGPTSTIYSLSWAASGGLAAGSADGSVWWWPAQGDPAHVDLGSPVHSVAVGPDGRTIAAGSEDNRARLWQPGSAKLPVVLEGSKGVVYGVAWAPDGRRVAVGGTDRMVHIYDVSGDSPREASTLTGPTSWVNGVAFDPTGSRVLGASSDRSLWIWDAQSGAPVAVLPHSSQVTGATWSADGRVVTTVANDGFTRVWQVPGPVLAGTTANIFALPTTGDGALVAAGASSGVQLWSLHGGSGEPATAPLLPTRPGITLSGSAAMTRDGRLVASGARDGSTLLWRLDASLHAAALPALDRQTQLVEQVVFSHDGTLLAAASDDGTVAVWQVRPTGEVVRAATLSGFAGSVQSVTFSPDGRYLAAGGVDRTVRVWNLGQWRLGHGAPVAVGAPLTGPTRYVFAVSWSPDGRFLAAGSDDHRVWVWAVGDATHPRRVATLTAATSFVDALAWSADGRHLAAGTGDGQVLLWHRAGGSRASGTNGGTRFDEEASVSASNDAVFAVSFAGDSGTLLSAGGDHHIHLWGTDVESAISSACSRVGSPLTAQEWHVLLPSVPYSPVCGGGSTASSAPEQ